MKTERLEAADVATIYKLWNEYADAINSKNMEQWRLLWCNDSIQLPAGAPKKTGIEQIQKLAQAQSDQFHSRLSINPEVVHILDDHAYTYGSYKTMWTSSIGDDKSKNQREGKFLTILQKQGDGSWKILVDCFNYNEVADMSGFCSQLTK